MFPPSRRRALACLGTAVALIGAAAPAHAADPAGRIGPLNPATQSSVDGQTRFVEAGGARFFTATDPAHGTELWQHTSGAAVRVADLRPGTASSLPQDLVAFDGELYFTAQGAEGRELWHSDGTSAGTGIVKDIRAGTAGSDPASLAVAGDRLFFSADDGATGRELWISDGSGAGTTLVADIEPGAPGSSPAWITAWGDSVAFSASRGATGAEPWISDGTGAGTTAIDDVRAGTSGSGPGQFAIVDDELYFTANATGATNGATFWRYDGTDLVALTGLPATPYKSINSVVGTATRLYFNLFTFDGVELWTFDGDAARMIPSVHGGDGASVQGLFADGDDLYFSADDGPHGRALYRTDGSATVPTNVSGDLPGYGPSAPPVRSGTSLFFTSSPAEGPAQIWELADAGGAATLVVDDADLNPGPLSAAGAGVYFPGGTAATGTEPHLLAGGDVTALGDLNTGLRGDDVGEIAEVGQTGYFVASTPQTGSELFRTDGVDATLVTDLEPGGQGSYPRDLTAFGDRLVFTAWDEDGGNEPWITDGATTERLADIVPGDSGSDPTGFFAADDELWFLAYDDEGAVGLYTSGGDGATRVAELDAGDDWSPIGVSGGALWFVYDGRLWSSDGTEGGTAPVALPDDRSALSGVVAKGDVVYVAADSALVKVAPGAAPVVVEDVGGHGIEELVALGSRVVFSSTGSDRRRGSTLSQLWVSDGTGAVEAGSGLTDIGGLVRAGKLVYFAAHDGAHGTELFRTDGTAAGTTLAVDLVPGSESGDPGRSVAVGGDLVVASGAGLHRVGPDGTVTPIYARGSAPGSLYGSLVRVGSSVLFPLREPGASNANLWSTPVGLIGPAPADVAWDEPEEPGDDGGKQEPLVVTTPAPPRAPAPVVTPPAPKPTPVAKPFGITRFVASARKGTGTLTVGAPKAGSLKITADGIRTIRVTLKAGTARVTIKPGKRLARTLRRRGRASVRLRLRYVPRGGPAVVVTRTVVFRRT